MIQRIQSIFLFLAATLMLTASAFNIWEGQSATGCFTSVNSIQILSECNELDNVKNIFYLLAIQVVFAILVLFSLFSYKNRKRQIILGGINSLIGSIFLILTFFITKEVSQSNDGNYHIGFFLPLAAIFLNILANRFIKKDDKLVRSLDRIR